MTKTLALAALILAVAGAPTLAYAQELLLHPGDGQEARRRRQDELHEEVRDGFLQCAGRRQEARRRRENLVHHQMREGWDEQLSSFQAGFHSDRASRTVVRHNVIPANAGIQSTARANPLFAALRSRSWMPACAGMTR